MNHFDNCDNKNIDTNQSNMGETGDGNTDELKFSNMSTKEYLNMMAQGAYGQSNEAGTGYTDYQSYGGYDSYGYNTNSQYSGTQYNEQYIEYVEDEVKTKKHKSKNHKTAKAKGQAGKVIKKCVLLVGSGLIFGLAAGGAFHLVEKYFDDDKYEIEENYDDNIVETETSPDYVIGSEYEIPGTAVVADGATDSMSLDVSDIAENVMPSVVSITIKSVTEYNAGFFGQTYEYESEGSGSGIIIGENDEELLIVTNNHVVADADTVSVAFIDEQVYEAKVKGTDSESDLAIIVVDLEDLSDETMSQIRIATIGNSDDLKVGEQVVAIGNALGYGQSVTTGIVSAKNRNNDTNSTPLIQTDAAINPGNSGGALLNMKGEVVGINSSKMASYDVEGMGYAIPITEVESIIDTLMNRETREKVAEAERGYLGIGCQTISQDASMMYGLPVGALVTEVSSGSGAYKAGIKRNQIITKFDGQTVSSAEGLVSMLEYYKAGETIEVVVMCPNDDEYKEKTVTVTLGKRSN